MSADELVKYILSGLSAGCLGLLLFIFRGLRSSIQKHGKRIGELETDQIIRRTRWEMWKELGEPERRKE